MINYKRFAQWLLLAYVVLSMPAAFVSCTNYDNPTSAPTPVQHEDWYNYLDSAQVREERGLANAEKYAPYTYRLERQDTARALPDNLRACTDAFNEANRSKMLEPDKDFTPSREGFDGLNLSGSTSTSYQQLDALTDWLKEKAGGKKIYILDLRSEYNMYVNGNLLNYYGFNNWANIGLKREDIIAGEKAHCSSIIGQTIPTGTFSEKTNYIIQDTLWIDVSEVMTEEQAVAKMAEAKGVDMMGYRITPLDHCFPVDQVIDDFLEFYRQVPKDAWVHMHCYAGRGRTTLFMTFFDMLRNPGVSERDIIYRQLLIGGVNLHYTFHEGDKLWRVPLFTEIDHMVGLMKLYAEENAANNYTKSWTEWKRSKR